MAPPHLSLANLLMVADQMTDDNGERRFNDLNAFLQVNSRLHHHLNPVLWREAAASTETTKRVLTHLIKTRNLKRLKYFLELGADVETLLPDFHTKLEVECPGPSPLIAAAYVDSVPMARLLLRNGAMVEYPEPPRFSAMHAARSAEMVQLLLDHHADPEKNSRNGTGYKPLHWYARRDNVAAMRAVLQHGVDVQPVFAGSLSWGEPMRLPLHDAAHRSLEAVLVLFEFGADVRRTAGSFSTALHFAANAGKLDIVRLLVERWPMDIQARNAHGETPLLMAVRAERNDVVRFLLRSWPEGAMENDDAWATPLHWAACLGLTELTSLLLECWPEGVKAKTQRCETPLHWAAQAGRIETMRLLVECWPLGIRERDIEGATPLHAAADAGWDVMMEPLLSE
jgi:ankyrin repeat protein